MPKTEGEIIAEKIHIPAIKVFRFTLESSPEYLDKPVQPKAIDFGIGKDIAHNLDEKMTRYRLLFQCSAHGENKESLGLETEIGIEFHFRVDNFDEFLSKTNEETKINAEIGTTLMSIAYSTARGIVLEKTQNTYFNGIILPSINPYELLMENTEGQGETENTA